MVTWAETDSDVRLKDFFGEKNALTEIAIVNWFVITHQYSFICAMDLTPWEGVWCRNQTKFIRLHSNAKVITWKASSLWCLHMSRAARQLLLYALLVSYQPLQSNHFKCSSSRAASRCSPLVRGASNKKRLIRARQADTAQPWKRSDALLSVLL